MSTFRISDLEQHVQPLSGNDIVGITQKSAGNYTTKQTYLSSIQKTVFDEIFVENNYRLGKKIATIHVNDKTYEISAPARNDGKEATFTEFSPELRTGIKIGTIGIDGVSTEIFQKEIFVPTRTEICVDNSMQISGNHIATLSIDGISTAIFSPYQTISSVNNKEQENGNIQLCADDIFNSECRLGSINGKDFNYSQNLNIEVISSLSIVPVEIEDGLKIADISCNGQEIVLKTYKQTITPEEIQVLNDNVKRMTIAIDILTKNTNYYDLVAGIFTIKASTVEDTIVKIYPSRLIVYDKTKTLTVDWGDNNSSTIVPEMYDDKSQYVSHTYAKNTAQKTLKLKTDICNFIYGLLENGKSWIEIEGNGTLFNITSLPQSTYNLSGAFKNLTALYNSGSNISIIENVTNVEHMFDSCTSFLPKTITFYTKDLSSLNSTFKNCTKFNIVPTFSDKTKIVDIANAFSNTAITQSFVLSDMTNLKNMASAFYNCKSMTTINGITAYSKFVPSNVENIDYAFYSSGLKYIPVLSDCTKLKHLNNTFRLSKVMMNNTANSKNIMPSTLVDMTNTFANCTNYFTVTLDLSNCNNITSMNETYLNCTGLATLATCTIPSSAVELNGTFKGCTALVKSPELSTFSNLSNVNNLFENSGITCIPHMINLSCLSSIIYTFRGSKINTANQNVAYVSSEFLPSTLVDMTKSFADIVATQFIYAPYISNLTNLSNMTDAFNGCTALQKIREIPESVKNMHQTFYNCKALTGNIIIRSKNISDTEGIFTGSTGAKNIYIYKDSTTYNSLEKEGYMFDTPNEGVTLKDIALLDNNIQLSVVTTTNKQITINKLPTVAGGSIVDWNDHTPIESATTGATNFTHKYSIARDYLIKISRYNQSDLPTSMQNAFLNNTIIKRIVFNNYNTNAITSFESTFSGCTNLESIAFDKLFLTTNAITMNSMFKNCSKLSSINTTTFNINKVANFQNMFYGCNSLSGDIWLNDSNLQDEATLVTNPVAGIFDNTGTERKNVHLHKQYVLESEVITTKLWQALIDAGYSDDSTSESLKNNVLLVDIDASKE